MLTLLPARLRWLALPGVLAAASALAAGSYGFKETEYSVSLQLGDVSPPAEVESVALANCRENAANCRVELCIALARGVDGAGGWAWGGTLREAAAQAVESCEAHDPCCRVTRGYCADELAR